MKRLVIERMNIRNFKGVRELDISFGEKVTRISGMNGTGKTTMDSAVRNELRQPADATFLSMRLVAVYQRWQACRRKGKRRPKPDQRRQAVIFFHRQGG